MRGLRRQTPWHCRVFLSIVFYSFKNGIILKLNLFTNIILHPGFPQNITDVFHLMAELGKRHFSGCLRCTLSLCPLSPRHAVLTGRADSF